jgi:hypothetical protein
MKPRNAFSVITILFSCLITLQVSAQTVYSSYNGSQQGITVRDYNLNQSIPIPTTFSPKSITAGLANTIYVTSGNNIRRYAANGVLLKNFTFPDPLINYTGVALSTSGANIYVSYKGSQLGVSIRNASTLAQTASFATPFSPNAIAVGPSNTLFLASGNHLYKYSTAGVQLMDINFPDAGVNYSGIVVKGNRVYASYNGSQKGVTIRSLNLNQLSFFGLGFSPSGIAAGLNNDVYLSTVDHLYRYTTAGALLKNVLFPTINYTGIATENSR